MRVIPFSTSALLGSMAGGFSRRGAALSNQNSPPTPISSTASTASISLRSPATEDFALRAIVNAFYGLGGPFTSCRAGIHQAQNRTAPIGIELDAGQNLEAAAEISHSFLPAPAHQLHGGAVLAPRPRREVPLAEQPRLALEAQRPRAHQGPGIPLAEGLQRRELRQERRRDFPRLEVQLIFVAAGEKLRRPALPRHLPLPPQLFQ